MSHLSSKTDRVPRIQPSRTAKALALSMPSKGNIVKKPKANKSILGRRTKAALSSVLPMLTDLDETPTTGIFFWKPHMAWGFLGQWYPSTFTDPETGLTFNCCEQYMMYNKAKTFGDETTMQKVLEATNPKTMKALGRQVEGFTSEGWDPVKFQVVVAANMLKFGTDCRAQHNDLFVYAPDGYAGEGSKEMSLKELLLNTGDRELVEASPRDRTWGIGFGPTNSPNVPREKWGQNLLGKALMEARKRLREEQGPAVTDLMGGVQGEKSAEAVESNT